MWTDKGDSRGLRRIAAAPALLVAGAAFSVLALGGCVSVNAPDKPIVIELNINIRQEVIYRLAGDAQDTIEDNPEIF
jgi:hypothetical protein